ncbi:hypothetical protein JOL79_31285 [Microbispora sp. RL4-1S]|uniref:Lipoprotein n=1 Tax=Microbispora oryzae TaxID=2806554 RepID=A0A940WQV0_9ACTN|nr:hypothetical protein [Microbispora oryzae]MBP2708272.1 hypothetical protein [Microbispora oryzae]
MFPHRAALSLGALCLTAALTAVLSGCSATQEQPGVASLQKGGDAAPSASPSASMNQQDALVKWAGCMRQNGVSVSDPGTTTGPLIPQGGVNSQTLQRAQQACRSYLQAAGGGQGNVSGTAALDRFLELAKCMRENGVQDFPDPVLDETGGVTFNGKIDRKAPHYQEAADACKSKLPSSGTWGGSR